MMKYKNIRNSLSETAFYFFARLVFSAFRKSDLKFSRMSIRNNCSKSKLHGSVLHLLQCWNGIYDNVYYKINSNGSRHVLLISLENFDCNSILNLLTKRLIKFECYTVTAATRPENFYRSMRNTNEEVMLVEPIV